jgi:hypothetical protein
MSRTFWRLAVSSLGKGGGGVEDISIHCHSGPTNKGSPCYRTTNLPSPYVLTPGKDR